MNFFGASRVPDGKKRDDMILLDGIAESGHAGMLHHIIDYFTD